MKKPRIDWSNDENDRVAKAIHEQAVARRLTLPLQKPWGKPSIVLELARTAQIGVIAEGRRRAFSSAEQLRGLIGRLINNGLLRESDIPWLKSFKPEGLSRDQIRINQLADERDAALNLATEAESRARAAEARVAELERTLRSIPQPIDMVQDFLGGILRKAWPTGPGTIGREANEAQAREMQKSRHNPEPTPTGVRKPKVIVGGLLPGPQVDETHAKFGAKLDLRFLTGDQLIARKDSIRSGDTIVAWIKFIGHDSMNGLPANVTVLPANTLGEIHKHLAAIAEKV